MKMCSMIPDIGRRPTVILSLVFSTVLLFGKTAGAIEPVRMETDADKQILQSYLKHCKGAVARVTRESVQRISEGESICWVWSKYVEMPLVAYQLTGDRKYVQDFVTAMDALLTRLRKGPDGFLGFRGLPLEFFRDKSNPTAEGDVVITAFAVTRLMCEFAEVIENDVDLKSRYEDKLADYLDIAENHLVAKWDVRERYVDMGTRGAIYRMGPHVGDHRKNLTHPHNKQSKACRALLALYRVTGKDEYFHKAVKLGVRFKHTLKLDGDRYLWHYWDPAGDWDRKIDDPNRWKHWIGAEHRGGYHALTLAMATALYDHGVVFDATDMRRFINTQMQVCWNGSFDNPVFRRTDGRSAGQHRFLAPALARFEPNIPKLLCEGPETKQRLARRDHSWQGGPVAMEYLRGKYLSPQSPEPTHTKYRTQFCESPENARFLKEIEFQIREDA